MPKKSFNLLPSKKQKYLKARVDGKSMKDAALEAGYAESTAYHASTHIETADVRTLFAQAMRRKISPTKLANVVNDGLLATETKFFADKGLVTDHREVIDFGERRMYANLAAQFGGYWSPKQEIAVTQKVDEGMVNKLIEISSKLGVQELEFDDRRALRKSHVPYIEAELSESSDEESAADDTDGDK